MFLPKRTEEHKTDTLAMKKVGLALGEDLLIRSMEERDYGIDALVEHYQTDSVGQMLFLQVKGTRTPISKLEKKVRNQQVVSLGNFPKRTLMYAEQFVQPFIAAYTCVEKGGTDSSPVYFLWLQRYIDRVLDKDDPDWRTSNPDNVTLHIPVGKENQDTQAALKELAQRTLHESQSLRLIKTYAQIQVLNNNLQKNEPWGDFERKELDWALRSLQKCNLVIAKSASDLKCNYSMALSAITNWLQRDFEAYDSGRSKSVHKGADELVKVPDSLLNTYLGALENTLMKIVSEILIRNTEH